MCGIAGIVTKDYRTPDEGVLQAMSGVIVHRGPDGHGLWRSDGVGLAHRRLAVIDLSPRGAQPMHSASKRYTIVYNGEIYNYKSLREGLGGTWMTTSDTEVILRGFEAEGTAFFSKLRGMFAFAIWDAEERRLVLARDPIGKKPLFWSMSANGDLYFASEIKALGGHVPFDVDWGAVRMFLGLQYVPSPKTGFVGVHQLRPGYYATYGAGEWHEEPYHSWEAAFFEPASVMAERDIDDAIRATLEDAVRVRQAASDVPVGAFLSGGIDSAAVTAYASRVGSRPLQTFTMGFPGFGSDERNEAREVSEYFHTDHYEFEAHPEHLVELLDTLVEQYDAPYADSSALPTWLLARKTAKQIKVVLTGDGGDEAFGGYRRYPAYFRALQLRPLPLVHAASFTGRVAKDFRFIRFSETVRASRRGAARGYAELFTGSYFGSRDLGRLLLPDVAEATRESDAAKFVERELVRLKSASHRNALERAMFFDLTSYLPDDLNVKMDRATMAFGLEARSPFLDQRIVELSLRFPLNQKVIHGKTKVGLRRALKGVLPESVLKRKKRGFQVPLAPWFRGPLRSVLEERCLSVSSPLRSVMDHGAVHRLIAENDRGWDHGNRLWMLLTLSTWLRNRNV